jgi:hypothetical protein
LPRSVSWFAGPPPRLFAAVHMHCAGVHTAVRYVSCSAKGMQHEALITRCLQHKTCKTQAHGSHQKAQTYTHTHNTCCLSRAKDTAKRSLCAHGAPSLAPLTGMHSTQCQAELYGHMPGSVS